MPRFPLTVLLLAAALSLLATDPVLAADKDNSVPSTRLTVQINSAVSGKGIDRASVIVKFTRPPEGHLRKIMRNTRTSWETKTGQQGSVAIPEIPQGFITIQVIADNYQTFGGVFELNQPEQTIAIKLNPPQSQYSEDIKSKDVKPTK